MEAVAAFFRDRWPNNEVLRRTGAQDYHTQLQSLGLLDCGVVGTPHVLSLLDIKEPDGNFIRRFRNHSFSSLTSTDRLRAGGSASDVANEEFAAAEANLS